VTNGGVLTEIGKGNGFPEKRKGRLTSVFLISKAGGTADECAIATLANGATSEGGAEGRGNIFLLSEILGQGARRTPLRVLEIS